MTELKLRSHHTASLQSLIEGVIADALRSIEAGIQRTKTRLQEFECQHHLSTTECLRRYENDEFQETLDLDAWIGESRMLERLLKRVEQLQGIELAP